MPNRTLVVFYSRNGTTARVAEQIAAALDADLERIEETGSRAGVGGYLRSGLEALAKGLPTIRARKDPRDYDLVVIGTPVWTGTMSSPMRSYVTAHRGALRHAVFFAVMGGRGGEDTIRELQIACGANERPGCVVTQREVERGTHRAKCDCFVQLLKDGGREKSPRSPSAVA